MIDLVTKSLKHKHKFLARTFLWKVSEFSMMMTCLACIIVVNDWICLPNFRALLHTNCPDGSHCGTASVAHIYVATCHGTSHAHSHKHAHTHVHTHKHTNTVPHACACSHPYCDTHAHTHHDLHTDQIHTHTHDASH